MSNKTRIKLERRVKRGFILSHVHVILDISIPCVKAAMYASIFSQMLNYINKLFTGKRAFIPYNLDNLVSNKKNTMTVLFFFSWNKMNKK